MQDLIVGYGYCGRFLSQRLQQQNQAFTAWSRTPPEDSNPNHQVVDISHDHVEIPGNIRTLYYLIPPQREGQTDDKLAHFLSKLAMPPKTIIYFGSSGVYGDHQGQWVTEKAPLHIQFDRQKRRQNAEQQLFGYCRHHQINLACLRIAGIYGPDRLPVQKAKTQQPVIKQTAAPYSNCIYVANLVQVASLLAETIQGRHIINVSDGQPNPMGYIQLKVAEFLGLPNPPEVNYETYYQSASPMAREFLASSKKLDNNKVKQLCQGFQFTSLTDGIKQSLVINND